MAKRLLPATEPEPQTLDEILDWHGGVVDALVAHRAAVQIAVTIGSAIAPRFVGMTQDDLDAHHDSQQRELDRLTALNLVASVEAAIRGDYFRRVEGRLKSPLAKAYRNWHKTLSAKKRRRPDFDEAGILEVLQGADVMDNNLIGRYRECLRARHWVGHGRYWTKPTAVDRLLPTDVYDRGLALLRALPP